VHAEVHEMSPTQGVADDVFERLLVDRYPDLLRLAYLILHDSAEAEDATQLALERAWRSRAQVRSPESVLSWLRRIVVREAVRARSSPWRLRRSPLQIADEEPSGGRADQPGRPERLDILSAFGRLPADQSAAVVLHHYLDYPVAEVAEMLGVPLETVRSRLRLAMRRLREDLRDA
jgi:RNA polymerase sigma-70 factor (ECF subfamily)